MKKRSALSWAFYDWANSAFATTVMAGFFPIFLKQYWGSGLEPTVTTDLLGKANSLAGLIVAVLAPVLGAIADQGGAKKRFLMGFTVLAVVMTGGLYLVEQGEWLAALMLYVAATVGFNGGMVFYDALIVDVADDAESDRVSAWGYSLGYLGGGLLFAVNVAMTLKPELFGLADAAMAVRVSYVMVAVWWAIFSIPLFLYVEEKGGGKHPGVITAIRDGFGQLLETLGKLRALKSIGVFLLAYWFYIDGVNTIIKMAVDYGLNLGFDSSSLIKALLLVQFVGFPAALLFGWLGERIGTKIGIFIGLGVYLLVSIGGYFMNSEREFYILAVAIGLVQGGVQSLSRSFYSRIIPEDQAAEFFGFYGMLGKFATILGPFLMGWVAVTTGSARLSIVSVAFLFLIGGLLLLMVSEAKAKQDLQLYRQG